MRKYGRKYMMALWMCVVLIVYATLMPGMFVTDRMALLIAAAVVACVYMVCETKIDCAAAPLNLPDELFEEKKKPPESDAE